jgi:hypothetical protein
MTELLNLLQEKAGINAEQATKSLHTIKEYVTDKFPMLAGAVDNMFAGATDKVVDTTKAAPMAAAASTTEATGGMLDKISDLVPGDAGQKIEDFAKNAADKAEDLFDGLKGKLGGLFGGDKKD